MNCVCCIEAKLWIVNLLLHLTSINWIYLFFPHVNRRIDNNESITPPPTIVNNLKPTQHTIPTGDGVILVGGRGEGVWPAGWVGDELTQHFWQFTKFRRSVKSKVQPGKWRWEGGVAHACRLTPPFAERYRQLNTVREFNKQSVQSLWRCKGWTLDTKPQDLATSSNGNSTTFVTQKG